MSPNSLIFKFLEAQEKNPVSGDWTGTVKQNLHDLNIQYNDQELKQIPRSKFSDIVENAIRQKAFEYLIRMRKFKGCEVKYNKFEMADYLKSINYELTIGDKQQLFSYRNSMNNLPANFASRSQDFKCQLKCDIETCEDMKHIWICPKIADLKTQNLDYTEIYNGVLEKQIRIFRIMKQKLEKREKILESS